MKVTCISGPKLQVVLVAETPVEIAFLNEMSQKSMRGEKTTLVSAVDFREGFKEDAPNNAAKHILEVG